MITSFPEIWKVRPDFLQDPLSDGWLHAKRYFARTSTKGVFANALTSEKKAATDAYMLLIQEYSQRNLTYSSDALIAFSAVAQSFAPLLGEYRAGLWRDGFLSFLTWVPWDKDQKAKTQTPHSRPSQYCAPSWSWASISGPVGWWPNAFWRTVAREADCSSLAEVVDISCELRDGHEFGRLSDAVLVLNARFCSWRVDEVHPEYTKFGTERIRIGGDWCKCQFDVKSDLDDLQGKDITFLEIRRLGEVIDYLILGEAGSGDYRRLGLFSASTGRSQENWAARSRINGGVGQRPKQRIRIR